MKGSGNFLELSAQLYGTWHRELHVDLALWVLAQELCSQQCSHMLSSTGVEQHESLHHRYLAVLGKSRADEFCMEGNRHRQHCLSPHFPSL